MAQNDELIAAPPKSRKIGTAVVLLIGTLIGGACLGAALDRVVLFHQHRLLPSTGMRFVASRVLARLDHELDLTPAQKAQVSTILNRRQAAIQKIWSQVQPQVRSQIDLTNGEIEAVLDARQRTRFRELRARWEKRAHHWPMTSNGD